MNDFESVLLTVEAEALFFPTAETVFPAKAIQLHLAMGKNMHIGLYIYNRWRNIGSSLI